MLRLPDNATLLASNDTDINQAFIVGGSTWGVQFHPEFDAEIIIEYINHYRGVLFEEKKNLYELIERSADTPYGSEILKRFTGVIKGNA